MNEDIKKEKRKRKKTGNRKELLFVQFLVQSRSPIRRFHAKWLFSFSHDLLFLSIGKKKSFPFEISIRVLKNFPSLNLILILNFPSSMHDAVYDAKNPLKIKTLPLINKLDLFPWILGQIYLQQIFPGPWELTQWYVLLSHAAHMKRNDYMTAYATAHQAGNLGRNHLFSTLFLILDLNLLASHWPELSVGFCLILNSILYVP